MNDFGPDRAAAAAPLTVRSDVRVCLDPAGHPFCLWIALTGRADRAPGARRRESAGS